MRESEKWLIFQTLLLVAFATWVFGGRISWAPPWIMGICALAVVPLALRAREARRRGQGTEDRGRRTVDGGRLTEDGSALGADDEGSSTPDPSSVPRPLSSETSSETPPSSVPRPPSSVHRPPSSVLPPLLLLPWLLLAAVVVTSLFNPSYEMVTGPDGERMLELQEFNTALPATIYTERTREVAGLLGLLLFQGVVVYTVLRTRRAVRVLLTLLVLNALVMAVAGAVVHLMDVDKIWGFRESPNPSFFGSFVMRNHWATYAVLALCASIGLFFREFHRSRRRNSRGSAAPFYLAAALLIAFTIPLSGSRAGMLLLGVVLLCFLFGHYLALIHRTTWSARVRQWFVVGSAAIFTAFLAYTLVLTLPIIEERWEQTQRHLERGTDYSRFHHWRSTWAMVEAKPVWGWGLGNFRYVHPEYATDHYRNRHGEQRRFLRDAHNDWLQYLSEIGWVGTILLLLVPIAILLRYAFRGFSNPVSNWALLGCFAMGLHAIVDFPFQSPGVFSLFIVLFAAATKHGLLDARARNGAQRPQQRASPSRRSRLGQFDPPEVEVVGTNATLEGQRPRLSVLQSGVQPPDPPFSSPTVSCLLPFPFTPPFPSLPTVFLR